MRKSKKKFHYFPLTVISKCREWHLRGTYLNFFPGATFPGSPPMGSQQCLAIMGMAMPGLKPPLLVDRAGISETGILKISFKILFCRLVNYSTTNSSGTSSDAPGHLKQLKYDKHVK